MKGKKFPVLFVLVLITGLICLAAGILMLRKYTPTNETKDLDVYYNLTSDDQAAIILNHELSDTQAKLIDQTVYVSYTYTHENLNQRLYWDANEELLLYAADTRLFTFTPDTVYEDYSDAPVVTVSDGDAYINISFLKQFSDFIFSYYESPSRLIITNLWEEEEVASPRSKTALRTLGGIKCPIVRTVTSSDKLIILSRDTKWTKVVTEDGMIGYIRSAKLSESSTETPVSDYTEEEHAHILLDNTVCLAWNQITSQDANAGITDYLDQIQGVNVIAPTWFCLSDADGNIVSYASTDYIAACHNQGIQVWPTINDVDFPDIDVDSVLSHTSTRTNLINSVISNAVEIGCDGINVDLERTTEAGSGTSYIEFIRELSIECASNNLILSVDNTKPYSFNQYYERQEQAYYADYLILMAYDEHYAGSEDGSVSSLAWTEEGITDTLAQGVPAGQLILGNPFYTRLWQVTPRDTSSSGDRLTDNEISSTIYGMSQAADLLKKQGVTTSYDSESGQNYAEWTEGDTTYEIWMEDSDSVSERMQLMKDYSLGGVAFWRLGLESSDIWETIMTYVK